jgi:hypothetical protein
MADRLQIFSVLFSIFTLYKILMGNATITMHCVCIINGGRILELVGQTAFPQGGQDQSDRVPANIKPVCIPGQVLYPRTVRARIFILPITCSVPLFVQGMAGSE